MIKKNNFFDFQVFFFHLITMQRETTPRKEEAYWKFYQTSMMELFYEKS